MEDEELTEDVLGDVDDAREQSDILSAEQEGASKGAEEPSSMKELEMLTDKVSILEDKISGLMSSIASLVEAGATIVEEPVQNVDGEPKQKPIMRLEDLDYD